MIKANILLLEVMAILPPPAYLPESTRKESQSRLPKAPEGLGLDCDSTRAIVKLPEKGHSEKPLFSITVILRPEMKFIQSLFYHTI